MGPRNILYKFKSGNYTKYVLWHTHEKIQIGKWIKLSLYSENNVNRENLDLEKKATRIFEFSKNYINSTKSLYSSNEEVANIIYNNT